MYNYVLAMALIIGENPNYSFSDLNSPPPVAECIRNIAVDWEILDPRETKYVLFPNFAQDLKMIQKRYEKLYDAPFVIDCERFPDRSFAYDARAFNRLYKIQIEFKLQVSVYQNREYWRQTLKETDYLYNVWDKVQDSHCQYYYVTVRREALKDLRNMIGEDAYYAGELPPYVPIWRFQNICR
jgi:hypothetical protein